MPDPIEKTSLSGMEKKRLDQYSAFLDPTLADDQDDFYSPIKPIIGRENSVANLQREDVASFLWGGTTAMQMLFHGQDDLALEIMTSGIQELKLSMSIDGKTLEHIFSNKIEYSQEQTLHEYQHAPEKRRGFFRRKE